MAVILLRGVSGAGKSTFIANHKEEGWKHIVSADHFFVNAAGIYEFNPAKLGEAHAACMRRFIDILTDCDGEGAFEDDWGTIFVDNTNTSVAEVSPYLAVAAAFGQTAKIVTLEIDPAIGAARNVHGVPLKTVQAQHDRLVRGAKGFMPWWAHEITPAVVP
jgi:predicted kinase